MMEPLIHKPIGIAAPHRGFQSDAGAEFVRIMKREVARQMAAHRASHVNRPVQLQFAAERDPIAHEPIPGQAVFLFPVPDRRRRQQFAVIGKVGGDHAEARSDFAIFQQMPILAAVGAGGVLAYERNTPAGLLEIDAILDAVELDVNVTANDV